MYINTCDILCDARSMQALKLRELDIEASFVATDINAEAVDATIETMTAHKLDAGVYMLVSCV